MSMQYIRKTYGVPAKRGGKVRYVPDGNRNLAHEGIIVGTRGAHLRIRMGNEKHAGIYHPTCDLEYLAEEPMKYTDCPCHDCAVLDVPAGEMHYCGCEEAGPVYNKTACSECPSREKCDVPKHPDLYNI